MMKAILIAALVLIAVPSHADVAEVNRSKGKYYEVHRNRDGSFTFFYVPSYDAVISVSGLKGEKAVLGFFGIRGRKGAAHTTLRKAGEQKLVNEHDPLVFFTVDVTTVDTLLLQHAVMPVGGRPGGRTYKTDLFWLIEEAKREGRFKDFQKKADEGAADKE